MSRDFLYIVFSFSFPLCSNSHTVFLKFQNTFSNSGFGAGGIALYRCRQNRWRIYTGFLNDSIISTRQSHGERTKVMGLYLRRWHWWTKKKSQLNSQFSTVLKWQNASILYYVQVKQIKKKTYFFASRKPLTKRAGSGAGAGSVNQVYGSKDPDPYQNVTDSEHWLELVDCSTFCLQI